MANKVYSKAREGFANGDIDWLLDDIRVLLLKGTGFFDDANQYVSDLAFFTELGRSASLTGKTSTNGVCDADDTSVTATATGTAACLVLYKHTGVDATSALIAYIDGYLEFICALSTNTVLSIPVDPLPGAIDNGTIASLVSGDSSDEGLAIAGPLAAGTRQLDLSTSTTGAILEGAVFQYVPSGGTAVGSINVSSVGQAVSIAWSNTGNKIFKL